MSLHTTAVFLGPSMPLDEARGLLDADYHPPARRGDIYRISASGVRVIVLIDGAFHNTPSIWPREVLDVLGDGIQVLGASSMGALRAAELHRFGMVGYGTIFEWYRDGLIDGDDEVALWHGPEEAGFCPLSEPLVNIRATLRKAVEDACISGTQERELLDYAKQTFYPERSYRHLLTCPALQAWPEADRAALEQYLLTKSVDLKRRDAAGILRHCATLQEQKLPAMLPDPLRSKSHFWQLNRMLLTGLLDSQAIRLGDEVLEASEKDPVLLDRLWPTLSTRGFLLDWASHNRIALPEQLLRDYIEQWERDRNITDHSDWLKANGLTRSSCRRLLAEHCLIDWLTTCGPGHFGLPCSSPASLRQEPQPTRTGQALHSIARPALPDLEDQPMQADQWTRSSQRAFLVDWARQNGVCCPADVLEQNVMQREGTDRGVAVPRHGRSDTQDLEEIDASPADEALTTWMVERGPFYFGLDWSFECTLLEELQISGMAAELLARVQTA